MTGYEGTVPLRQRGAALVVVLALLVPVVGVPGAVAPGHAQERSSSEVERELDRTSRERDSVSGELAGVRERLGDAEEELAVIGARLEDARAELTAAEGQLELAEIALADAEQARDEAVAAHELALELLAEAEEELALQEEILVLHLVHTYKHGSSGAQAGEMVLEIIRRAEDPNAFSVSMKQLETVVDVQDRTVTEYVELHAAREQRSEEAATARAAAIAAEAEAAETLEVVERLRAEAAALAEQVAAEEQAQQAMVESLRTTEAETADMLQRVETRQAALEQELAEARAAEEAARREAERRAQEEAAAAEAARSSAGSSSSGSNGGRLSTPGASGGPSVSGVVCPVQGAVAGRDFINDWGFPRSGGRTHQGNDIFASRGTPVVAVADGTVTRMNPPSAPTALGGITVTYRIGDGSEWYNAHLDTIANGIARGASVSRGQVIGTVGNTGNARTTPPHLHIGRRHAGSWVNPWPTISPVC